jgi:hypothetical protein
MALLLASSASTGIGVALGGIAAVLVISAVFYVIGRGEDRDRAATHAAAAQDEPDVARETPPPAEARLPARTPRRRRR